ncbi:AraC family transcriptional regulator [Desulfospira joergensenii]|uniref:AraC family transcriptional regulator n=1 Tax=Desulfospira joergensenii TaxID=53329 RepID=UPI0003B540F3|nr:AraC family transcriptional regulator [Desulfospira joergensenii]
MDTDSRQNPGSTSEDQTLFSRFPELGNLEILHASYRKQEFQPHFHEGHVIGVIEKGCLGFDYRGEKVAAGPGEINIADPGEVHNGFALSDRGWQYRMFYLAPGQLHTAYEEICEKSCSMPFFKKGVIRDPGLAREIHSLHRAVQDPRVSILEKESRLITLVLNLVRRHAPESPGPIKPGKEKRSVARLRSYINDRFHAGLTLDDLGREAGLSKYYLLRSFKAHTGMTPHAYLSFVRAGKAREMMDRGLAIAETAQEAGFFDQSHLNRIFKKVFGITPGQYAASAGKPKK